MVYKPEYPIDPYSGPPWFATEPEELSPGERDDEIVMMRRWDSAGKDSAFEFGLTDNEMPAQGEGKYPRLNASREELLP